jgi:hypothetical protein
MNNIISTAHLMGGIGNQLFQISNAMCQGWKNNIPSIFKPTSYTPMQGCQPNIYLDNIFRSVNFYDTLPETKRIYGTFNYTETICDWKTSNEFYGFYQSSKYFLGYNDVLKDIFKPTEEFIKKIEGLYPGFMSSQTLSLHVRRSDYLLISNILPVIDKTYIDESIRQNGHYDTLYVFSEDKKWVKENLNYDNMVIVDNLNFDYEELWMISLCQNNIMSNSSFSWWGSFLNQNVDKKIFVPSIWFGPDGESNYSDIYEDYHIKINVKFINGLLKYER